MKRYILVILFSIAHSAISLAGGQLGYYYGDSSPETIQNQDFIAFDDKINNGLDNGTYWLKVVTDEQSDVIEIVAPRILEVACYVNGIEIKRLTKSLLPAFIIGKNSEAYICVHCQKEAYIPIRLYDQSAFRSHDQNRFLTIGLYYGFALMIIVMNLFYYFNFKENTFLYYAFFLLSISWGLVHRDGLFPILTSNHWLIADGEVLIHMLIPVSGSIFAATYLQHNIHLPRLKYIAFAMHVIVAILYIMYIVTNEFVWFAVGDLVAINILTLYWISGVYLFNKNTFSKFFTVAYSLILILAFDFFISPLFGIPNIGMTTKFLKIGGVFEMLILSFAVVFRMKELKSEYDMMQTKLYTRIQQISELENELEKLRKGEVNTISNVVLNSREIEILSLISQGKSNQEMASELFVSVNTVKYHVKKLYTKLEISSREEALHKATEIQILAD